MACSVHFGGLMIWKAGILSSGRARVNNTFALGARKPQFPAHFRLPAAETAVNAAAKSPA